MNGFQRRREKKMKSILVAAWELFLMRGIKDVSISEIAKKAQVSQASIYNFFQSKENLVRETLFAYIQEEAKESETILESEIPFREKMEKLLFMVDEATRQTSPELFESAASMDPSIRDLLVEYATKISDPFILRLVEQGRAEGLINDHYSNEAILLFIGSLRSVLMQPNVTKEARIGLNALFFYGVTGKPKIL
jgi:AcrR family transcriptional regulator